MMCITKTLLTTCIGFLCLPYTLTAQSFVTYEDFGAKGDGKTNDIAAIVAAHKYANEKKKSVKVNKDACYYIGGDAQCATIQTDTDFQTARFIIDDRDAKNGSMPVFRVQSDLPEAKTPTITSLKKGQSRLSYRPGKETLITVENSEVMHYIRRGGNANNGSAQSDIFLVDASGNVNQQCPILWDFDKITKITAKTVDKEVLTIKGGEFTTISNLIEEGHAYYKRGFEITRSRVMIEGLQHKITGEDGEHSYPYLGFINLNHCAYITVKDCILSGHKTFYETRDNGLRVPSGSYDIALSHTLFANFINCTQFNSIHDKKHWGIMAANYSKNIVYDKCKLSRYDAHRGIANGQVLNSEIGHAGINLIGSGSFLLENSTIHGGRIINFRSDYGSTWDGDITIKDCTWDLSHSSAKATCILTGGNDAQHDFGYICSMPQNITIQNLLIKDKNLDKKSKLYLFDNFNNTIQKSGPKKEQKYPYTLPQTVITQGVKSELKRTLETSSNQYLFQELPIQSKP